MVCHITASAACPSLALNMFWKFLTNNTIWFSIVLWAMALLQLLLGYFVIRITILLHGVMTGAIFGLIFTAVNFVDYVSEDNAHSLCIVIVLLSFLLGTLFGIVLLTLPKLGYVNIGIWVATIFSLLLQNSVLYRTGSMLGFYITFGVSALLMTAVALLALRYFIILSTAFVSAFWLVRPLGFFLDYYPNEFETARLQTINSNTPWQFYLYLLSIIVLTLLGSVCQFCLYRKKGAGNGGHGYYLEEEGTLKEKLEKLLEFKQIREIVRKGKDEFMFLKNIVVEDEDEDQSEGSYKKMTKEDNNKSKVNKIRNNEEKEQENEMSDEIGRQDDEYAQKNMRGKQPNKYKQQQQEYIEMKNISLRRNKQQQASDANQSKERRDRTQSNNDTQNKLSSKVIIIPNTANQAATTKSIPKSELENSEDNANKDIPKQKKKAVAKTAEGALLSNDPLSRRKAKVQKHSSQSSEQEQYKKDEYAAKDTRNKQKAKL